MELEVGHGHRAAGHERGAAGEEAGLAITGRTCAALAVRRNGTVNQLVFRENGDNQIVSQSAPDPLNLRVRVMDGGSCRFAFLSGNGKWETVPAIFQASAGEWIGAKVGIYSLTPDRAAQGHADFDYFRFAP